MKLTIIFENIRINPVMLITRQNELNVRGLDIDVVGEWHEMADVGHVST